MNVFFLSNIPSPYNVSYLEELGKLANVEAAFEKISAVGRDASWSEINPQHFKMQILDGVRTDSDKALCFNVIKAINQHKNWNIIIGNQFTPTGILAIKYCQYKHIPYILQSEGGFPGGSNRIKERLKHNIIKNAMLCFSGMSYPNDYFIYYGAKTENVIKYPFTSLYKNQILSERISKEKKEDIRNQFDIKYKKVIVSVGRMVKFKGFDVLIKSFSNLRMDDVGLYIIGGNPDEELNNIIESLKVQNIQFIPFLSHDDLIEFYKASDIFVLATRGDTWGLVINEAMSVGLPVITTDRCVAGNELIESGTNGYIFHCDNVEELNEDLSLLLSDSKLANNIGDEGLKTIQQYTYENMAETIFDALKSRNLC